MATRRKDFKILKKKYGWTSASGNARSGARMKRDGDGFSASIYSKNDGNYHLVVKTANGGKVNADYKDVPLTEIDDMMRNIFELAKVNLNIDLTPPVKPNKVKATKRKEKNDKILAQYGQGTAISLPEDVSMTAPTIEIPVPDELPMEAPVMTDTNVIDTNDEPDFEPIVIEFEDDVERHFAAPSETEMRTPSVDEPIKEFAAPDLTHDVEPPTTVEPEPEPITLPVETEAPPTKEDDPFVKPMEQDEDDYLPVYMETDEADGYSPVARVKYGSPFVRASRRDAKYGTPQSSSSVADVDNALAAETTRREFQPLRSHPNFPFAGRPTSVDAVSRALNINKQAIEDVNVQILDEVKTKNGTGYDVEQKFGTDYYGLDARPYINGNEPPELDMDDLKANYGKQDLPTLANVKHPLQISARVAPLLLMLGSGLVGYLLLKKLGHQ